MPRSAQPLRFASRSAGVIVGEDLAQVGGAIAAEDADGVVDVAGVDGVAVLEQPVELRQHAASQLALEEAVSFLYGMVDDFIGPKGRNYVTLVGTMFIFILFGNLMGLVPGLKSPTSNFNVTLGCALTVFVYYQFHGIKEQGIVGYVKHFLTPPGAPIWIAPIYFPIEIISHLSRVLSLSVRLFGNIFGEDLVIIILASLVPFVLPLPMMFLGLITSALQAYIFSMLTTIYLAGAVVVDHGPDGHGDHGEAHGPAAAEAGAA